MVSYEIFKGVVAEKFMDYMLEKYQGKKIEIRAMDKVNATFDVMNLVGIVTEAPMVYKAGRSR